MQTGNQKLIILISACFLSSCANLVSVQNFEESDQPRYASIQIKDSPGQAPKSILLATHNIELGRRIDRAVKLFSSNEILRKADVICLQEMSSEGVEKLANSLGYDYIYYPSAIHPDSKKEFGNAVLSRWPIIEDRKISLPLAEKDGFYRIRRIGVLAEIRVGNKQLSIVSTHMGTILSHKHRRYQVQALLKAIDPKKRHVIIAGDFNSCTRHHRRTVENAMKKNNYIFMTSGVKWTYKYWYLFNSKAVLDLVFAKGLMPAGSGSVEDFSVSDHLPIWAEMKWK